MALTVEQVSYFETFGFLKFTGLFADEADELTRRFDGLWSAHGGGHQGKEHDHERRSVLMQFVDRDEYLSGLLDDPRIEGATASLLGDDFNYMGGSGNYYVGDSQWHSDSQDSKYTSIKLAFYLDPLTADTGCLRVIPGSHKIGDRFADALQSSVQREQRLPTPNLWGVEGKDVPATALETEPGDVLLFDQRVKHASFGGSTMRKMMTMNFENRYAEEDLPELREKMGGMVRHWVEQSYGDVMIATAGPERMRHLEQRLANDSHLMGLVAKARQEMDEPARG